MSNYLFDQPINPGHPWYQPKNDLAACPKIERRVLERNLSSDGRVETSTELMSHRCFPPAWKNSLYEGLGSFFRERYIDTSQVRFASNTVIAPAPKENLFRMVNFTKLLSNAVKKEPSKTTINLKGLKLPSYPALFNKPGNNRGSSTNDFMESLMEELNNAEEDIFQRFMKFLFSVSHHSFLWATFKRDISKHFNDAEHLVSAVGIKPADRWWLRLEYPAREAGTMYMPTMLESNLSPFHFPNPPSLKTGLTMPADSSIKPVREVLHKPQRPEKLAAASVRPILEIRSAVSQDEDVELLREKHTMNLRKKYKDASDQDWMNRHFP